MNVAIEPGPQSAIVAYLILAGSILLIAAGTRFYFARSSNPKHREWLKRSGKPDLFGIIPIGIVGVIQGTRTGTQLTVGQHLVWLLGAGLLFVPPVILGLRYLKAHTGDDYNAVVFRQSTNPKHRKLFWKVIAVCTAVAFVLIPLWAYFLDKTLGWKVL